MSAIRSFPSGVSMRNRNRRLAEAPRSPVSVLRAAAPVARRCRVAAGPRLFGNRGELVQVTFGAGDIRREDSGNTCEGLSVSGTLRRSPTYPLDKGVRVSCFKVIVPNFCCTFVRQLWFGHTTCSLGAINLSLMVGDIQGVS